MTHYGQETQLTFYCVYGMKSIAAGKNFTAETGNGHTTII